MDRIDEITEKTIHSYKKAMDYAKENICPPGVNGAYFDPENGEIYCWATDEFKPGTGMLFVHYNEFKYRGKTDDYIKHLEQLVDRLSSEQPAHDYSKAEKLIIEGAREFEMVSSISRYCPWAEEVVKLAKELP